MVVWLLRPYTDGTPYALVAHPALGTGNARRSRHWECAAISALVQHRILSA
jgi:hypothetical protein